MVAGGTTGPVPALLPLLCWLPRYRRATGQQTGACFWSSCFPGQRSPGVGLRCHTGPASLRLWARQPHAERNLLHVHSCRACG